MALTLNVVIPVFNQSYALAQTLFGFTQQIPPFNQCRITVVDDGSWEPINAIVAAYSNELNIKYIRLSRSGRAAARNAGVRASDSDIIVFCDADRIPRPGFLAAHYQSQRHSYGVVVGHVMEMYVSQPEANRKIVLERYMNDRMLRIPQYCKLIYKLFDDHGDTRSPIAWAAMLSGNLSMPADYIRELGGFDDRFKSWGFEHMEFGYRAYRKGIPFHYEADAINVHIAHSRKEQSYELLITNSHSLFANKHPDEAVMRYLDFMLGKISLRQFESMAADDDMLDEANHSGSKLDDDEYVRITS
ncbi:glycosyltransferase family 2 protein [Paenibacillus kobensis]|uniref:glycosyltransferase family 2 protein n=1 Tax=Paenibacillus kobensis TaxID=59841 RepID=UPI000FD7B53B|nr:glycosyltransferase [Paenibacillus kobensis]